MPSTTNFRQWLDGERLDFDSALQLVMAAGFRRSHEPWKVAKNDWGRVFISRNESNHTLVLPTEKAITAFVNHVDRLFSGELAVALQETAEEEEKRRGLIEW